MSHFFRQSLGFVFASTVFLLNTALLHAQEPQSHHVYASGFSEVSSLGVKPIAIPKPEAQSSSVVKESTSSTMRLLSLPEVIEWTVTEEHRFSTQAALWGLPTKTLLSLNPDYKADSKLKPGEVLTVHRRSLYEKAPQSVSSPSRGRLQYAVPIPEGRGYFLRSYRPRSWGTLNMVEALMTAFAAYADAYPEGPAVNMGDLSKRRGGKASPHKSHRSGRDVDFGLVHTSEPDPDHPERFVHAKADNLDVEKTWFLLNALLKTGEVAVIYLDASLQRLLYQEAIKSISVQEAQAIFAVPRHKNSSSALVQHWKGHKNHFHVRFKCPPGQPRCRG